MAEHDIDHISAPPQIIVEGYATPDIERRILNIDKRIHEYPKAFQAEIRQIGATALESIDISKRDERVVHAAKKAADLIKEFIENRYDYDSLYDQATEEALKQDPTYFQLIEDSHKTEKHSSNNISVSDNDQTNTEAEKARDKVRLYRLQAYIDRVAAYRAQSAPPDSGSLSNAV